MRSLYYSVLNGSPSTSSTTYNFLNGRAITSQTSESVRNQVVSSGGTFSNLRISLGAAPGSGKSYTFRLRVNGSNTNIVVTISDTDTTGVDSSNTATVSAGDIVSFSCTPSGTPTAASSVRFCIQFSGSTEKESLLIGGTGSNSHSSGGPYYSNAVSAYSGASETGVADEDSVIAVSGTIKNLYVAMSTAPGSGKSRTFTLMVNGSASSLSCTVSDTSTLANNTSDTVSVSAGDKISIKDTTSGSPTSTSGIKTSLTLVADVDGQFNISGMVYSTVGTLTTEYLPIASARASGDAVGTSTESSTATITNSVTINAIYVDLTFPPGPSPRQRVFTLRKNSSDTSVACTITSLTKTGSSTSNSVYFSDGDSLSISNVPSGDSVMGETNEARHAFAATLVGLDIYDAVSISESVTLQISGTYNIDVSDSLSITDSVSILGDFMINVSEDISISESLSLNNGLLGDININDQVLISETVIVEFVRSRGKIIMRSTGQTYPLPMDDRRVL